MKNKMRNYHYLVYLILLLPVLCQAGGAGWTDYGNIAYLSVDEKGRIVVTVDVSKNTTDCRNKTTFYHDQKRHGSDYILQVLLKALTEDKKVRIYQTSVCDLNNYTYIFAVAIMP